MKIECGEPAESQWVWRQCVSGLALADIHPTFPSNNAIPIPSEQLPLSQDSVDTISSCPVVATSFVYWPTAQDCGHCLLLECTPRNANSEEGHPVVICSNTVVPGIRSIPIEERHLFTPSYLEEPNQFRIVSYNILANVYALSQRAREVLYPYCDIQALNQDYRQSLTVTELLGYHADVLCLQEVGTKCFSEYLSPTLHHWGYTGCFHEKAGQV